MEHFTIPQRRSGYQTVAVWSLAERGRCAREAVPASEERWPMRAVVTGVEAFCPSPSPIFRRAPPSDWLSLTSALNMRRLAIFYRLGLRSPFPAHPLFCSPCAVRLFIFQASSCLLSQSLIDSSDSVSFRIHSVTHSSRRTARRLQIFDSHCLLRPFTYSGQNQPFTRRFCWQNRRRLSSSLLKCAHSSPLIHSH